MSQISPYVILTTDIYIEGVDIVQTQAVQAFDGYIEGGQFYPAGTSITLPGRFRAVLTVIMDVQPPFPQGEDDTTHWADELNRMIEACDSPLLRNEDFPRMDFGREPICFANEGERL